HGKVVGRCGEDKDRNKDRRAEAGPGRYRPQGGQNDEALQKHGEQNADGSGGKKEATEKCGDGGGSEDLSSYTSQKQAGAYGGRHPVLRQPQGAGGAWPACGPGREGAS